MLSRSLVFRLFIVFILVVIPIVPVESQRNDFVEWRFRESVSKALKSIETILDTTRNNPRLLEDNVDHTYDDKYTIADFITNTAIASNWNAFDFMGLLKIQTGEPTLLQTVLSWVHNDHQSVTLRFHAEDYCSYMKEQEIEVVTHANVEEVEITTEGSSSPSYFGILQGYNNNDNEETTTHRKTKKIITKVIEYHWEVGLSYKFVIFHGNDVHSGIELLSRNSSTTIITSGGTATGGSANDRPPSGPIPKRTYHDPIDINLTWLLQMTSNDDYQTPQFTINRFPKSTSNNNNNNNRSGTNNNIKHDDDSVDESTKNQKKGNQRQRRVDSMQEEDQKVAKSSSSTTTTATRTTTNTSCKTPRRNDDIQKAIEFHANLSRWAAAIKTFFKSRVEQVILGKKKHQHPENDTTASTSLIKVIGQGNNLFVPILPITQPDDDDNNDDNDNSSSDDEEDVVLSNKDVKLLLTNQRNTINDAIHQISKQFPPFSTIYDLRDNNILSVTEAKTVMLCQHLIKITEQYRDSINYIEHLLKKQLIQAIGKEVHANDFDKFMTFYNQKLFRQQYAPMPFSHAVRRPNHFPDGVISIESSSGSNMGEPIETFVRRLPGGAGVGDDESNIGDSSTLSSNYIPIDAATSIEINGNKYLHGWMQHRWSYNQPQRFVHNTYQFVARSNQFSNYVLVLGTMVGPNKFQPKDAIIIQNKDEVIIPLLTEILPSAKEFNDAITSLSPEQQNFAKAFRNMQLQSSVFGICIIQLKPQLEKLLGLPNGSLTKEIQLTQDLMSLFIEYQIPPDLLSFDGKSNSKSDETPDSEKINAVKHYVKAVNDVIYNEKEKQLSEEERRKNMSESMRSTPSLSSSPSAAPSDSPSLGPISATAMASESTRAADETAQSSSSTTSTSSSGKEQAGTSHGGGDFTLIPLLLDDKLEKYDTDGSVKSTIVKAATDGWSRKRQENLLTGSRTRHLYREVIELEKKKTFDLLVALSRSGSLPIDCSELHVIIAVSHCFENDIMSSIIEDNINPIEKVEKSMLMVASTIHDYNNDQVAERGGSIIRDLIQNDETLERLTDLFPILFNSTTVSTSTT